MAQSEPYRAISAYRWDLTKEVLSEFGAKMDRIGAKTLVVAVAYHAGKLIHPNGREGKVSFPQAGVAHFSFHRDIFLYLKFLDVLFSHDDDVPARCCAQEGKTVSPWTILLRICRLDAVALQVVDLNAFEDELPYSLRSLAPEVRDYAVTHCVDIAKSYPISDLSLETLGWLQSPQGYHHQIALIPPSPGREFSLKFHYCANCARGLEGGGIDVVGVQARLCSWIETALAAKREPNVVADWMWLESALLRDAEFAAFLRWRCDAVARLVAENRAATRTDATVHVIPSANQPPALAWMEGGELSGVDAPCNWLELSPCNSAALYNHAPIAKQIGHSDTRVILRPTVKEGRIEEAFSEVISGLAEVGGDGFVFYNCGHTRLSGVDRMGRVLERI